MPRKKKSNTPQVKVDRGVFYCSPDAVWGGFLNVRLDAEQIEQFQGWFAVNGENFDHLFIEFLDEEGKVTAVYDRENQCYIVSFVGALCDGSNERYVSTSRASTFREATALAVWKHFVLAEGDYSNFKPFDSTMKSWG